MNRWQIPFWKNLFLGTFLQLITLVVNVTMFPSHRPKAFFVSHLWWGEIGCEMFLLLLWQCKPYSSRCSWWCCCCQCYNKLHFYKFRFFVLILAIIFSFPLSYDRITKKPNLRLYVKSLSCMYVNCWEEKIFIIYLHINILSISLSVYVACFSWEFH